MLGNSGGIQTFVNTILPPGIAGDFAGSPTRATVVAGSGAYVAPPAGTLVGFGAWANPNTNLLTNYFVPGAFQAFIHRDQQGLITPFLGFATAQIPQGNEVTGFAQGDFWGQFVAGGSAGNKVYFDPVTGALSAAATGNAVTVTITAGGASVTSGVLTTTDADVTGTIAVGQIVVDSGGNLPPGTYISAANGTGSGTHLWMLSNADSTPIPNVSAGALTWTLYGKRESKWTLAEAVVANASFTAALAAPTSGTAFGILTVTAVASGSILPGQWISATGLALSSNVQILEQLTSTAAGGALGSTGTYLTNNPSFVIGSTNTFASTQGQVGKISSWL